MKATHGRETYIACVKRDTVTAKCELRLVTEPIREEERSRAVKSNKGKTEHTDGVEETTPAMLMFEVKSNGTSGREGGGGGQEQSCLLKLQKYCFLGRGPSQSKRHVS